MSDEVRRHFRHNLLFNILDGTFFQFGISFTSPVAILPVYVSHLTNDPRVLGLSLAMLDMGFFLPQLFTAPFVVRMARTKPYVLAVGLVQRVPFWLLALAVWYFRDAPGALMLWIYFGLTALKAVPGGLVGTAWQVMIGKVIPVDWRGRHFGTTFLLGGALGILGAGVAQVVLERFPYPDNFAICFLLSAAGVTASWLFVAQTREPAAPPPAAPLAGRAYWQAVGAILRRDGNFGRFLVARAFGYLGWMSLSFFAVYGLQRVGGGDAQAAVFLAVMTASNVFSNILWGLVGDRWGHKRTLSLSTVLGVLALALALRATSLAEFYGVFVLVGAASAGFVVGDLSLVMEFGAEHERATYVGLSRTLLAPCLGLGPLIGGQLAAWWGYPAMFVVALGCSLVSAALLVWTVREPRTWVDGSID